MKSFYRPEIDGLRALAVIPVILFHAGFDLFSGGFVGVDVFFVISGYLITTILIEDIENKRFSIVNFYERRARRILPALFFVMLVCIPFAWLWMLPSQMKDFAQSLVAVSLFASNILFWQESGYFDAAAEEKPLLHTWSLAVEEQYYLLFPIFLILAWRFGKNRVFWMIVVMAAISLLLSEWGWRKQPTANFYLAPTRAWELLAGSITAFIVQNQGVQKNNGLSLLGLAAIIFSIFFFNETTPFPSVYALIPVLGVVLLVLYADKKTFVAKLLSTKAFVGIGLISYSAYLWHQPLFAFARIELIESPSKALMGFLALASFVLAYGSWKYVEKPFRNKKKTGRVKILLTSFFGIALFATFGLMGHKLDGFKDRLENYQLEILKWEQYPHKIAIREGDCFLRPQQSYREFKSECIQNNAETLIWGDSHAAALSSGWRTIMNLHQLTASGCPPILHSEFPSRRQCPDINKHIINIISEQKYKTVILHAYWKRYSDEQLKDLPLTISELRKIGVENIVLIGGVPEYLPSLPIRLFKEGVQLNAISVIKKQQSKVANYDDKLIALIDGINIKFINALDIFCNAETCKVTTEFKGEVTPMVWDYGHLTEGGALWFLSQIEGIRLNEPAE